MKLLCDISTALSTKETEPEVEEPGRGPTQSACSQCRSELALSPATAASQTKHTLGLWGGSAFPGRASLIRSQRAVQKPAVLSATEGRACSAGTKGLSQGDWTMGAEGRKQRHK